MLLNEKYARIAKFPFDLQLGVSACGVCSRIYFVVGPFLDDR